MRTVNPLPMLALLTGLALALPGAAVRAHPETFAPIIQAQRGKVVHIDTTSRRPPGGAGKRGTPFQLPQPDEGTGSGFIVSADGYIVTNHHVLDGADTVEVVLADERRFTAEIIGLDAQTDLALVKIEASGLPVATFGDSSRLAVGDWVLAIGNPLGLDHTVTVGIISAKGRNIFDDRNLAYGEFLQTDAAINPGNSGGPLFNLAGEVVGVNSAISRRGQGIGFAVPSDLVVQVLAQLKRHGRVQRGWLGVVILELTRDVAARLGLPPETRGVRLEEVLPDSPAFAAGLREGDVLTRFRNEALRRVAQLQKLVALSAPGSEPVAEGLRRAGPDLPWEALRVRLRIGAAPASAALDGPSALERLGIRALNIPDDLRARIQLGGKAGVLVEGVRVGSSAADVGLQAGDIILEVNRSEVGSRSALDARLRELRGERVALLVQREQQVLFLVIDPAGRAR